MSAPSSVVATVALTVNCPWSGVASGPSVVGTATGFHGSGSAVDFVSMSCAVESGAAPSSPSSGSESIL